MSKELKTLKDFEDKCHSNLPMLKFLGELKAEAVKWAKKMEMKDCPYCKSLFLDFFNITEEDLK